jgi:hypothetical protein
MELYAMTLDLDELTLGWDCPPGDLRARMVIGRDGDELVQLRLDLGVMQMICTGRPDGLMVRGFPSCREFIEHELRVDPDGLSRADWQELQRELNQTNYRRLAFTTLAEDALGENDALGTTRYISFALRDSDECLTLLRLLEQHGPGEPSESLRPTLVFDRARLLSQLRVVEGHFDDAIEQAEHGASTLERLLGELGYDEELREEDPGVQYLRDLGHQLRREYGVTQTLREKLEDALEREDFETAARIRDQLQRQTRADRENDTGRPQRP